jgi:hypothetical protein
VLEVNVLRLAGELRDPVGLIICSVILLSGRVVFLYRKDFLDDIRTRRPVIDFFVRLFIDFE